MTTFHLISHTHWDREWYLTFQQFRLKLVQMVDQLLELMEADPDYCYFMLDGQTIVLDDYLEIRPEREAQLRRLIQEGRLLIGPWYILPDEFLVSPEAIVRNLLQGARSAREFGPRMDAGYIPDPFGHIGQMPQILRGFGIGTACVQRGLSDEPCEFWWQAPDGSRVLMAYLRNGYGNAARLLTSRPDDFVAEVRRRGEQLSAHSATRQVLLMQGTDHLPADPATSAAVGYAKDRLDGDNLVHSTLPGYLAAVQADILGEAVQLPTVYGELRSPKRHFLLPGVLSTRTWIKQRNHDCEILLEKWAEPFSSFLAWIEPLGGAAGDSRLTGRSRLQQPAPVLRHAWRLLLSCQPHDSICGCSIDAVHEEMRPRFDQVEQIGEEISRQSLEGLASRVDTRLDGVPDAESAIVVFNPTGRASSGLVRISLPSARAGEALQILDGDGQAVPFQTGETVRREVAYLALDRSALLDMLQASQDGRVSGMTVREVRFQQETAGLVIEAVVSESGEPDPAVLEQALTRLNEVLSDLTLDRFILKAHISTTWVDFAAQEVPGWGYRTWWVRHVPAAPDAGSPVTVPDRQEPVIENQFLSLEASPADGALTLTDKRTGAVYPGLNRFVDGGDCGDLYNYSPPDRDILVQVGEIQGLRVERGEAAQSIEISLLLRVPLELGHDRLSRSGSLVDLPVRTTATLVPGVPQLRIRTQVSNQARDHRLRVHFPAPFAARYADYDGHYEVVRRPAGVPAFDSTWAEQPRPEQPQRTFVDISDGQRGWMVANRGLREVEVMSPAGEQAEIALTLLRCTGWLSRDDYATRRGHAGPSLATPGGQMRGDWTFEYAVIPHEGGHEGGWLQAFQEASAFNAPLRGTTTHLHSGPLPAEGSFLTAEPDAFAISAVKEAEDGAGWIVRGYNLSDEPIQARVQAGRDFSRVYRASLSEEELVALPHEEGGTVRFNAGPHEIVTLKFGLFDE